MGDVYRCVEEGGSRVFCQVIVDINHEDVDRVIHLIAYPRA